MRRSHHSWPRSCSGKGQGKARQAATLYPCVIALHNNAGAQQSARPAHRYRQRCLTCTRAHLRSVVTQILAITALISPHAIRAPVFPVTREQYPFRGGGPGCELSPLPVHASTNEKYEGPSCLRFEVRGIVRGSPRFTEVVFVGVDHDAAADDAIRTTEFD